MWQIGDVRISNDLTYQCSFPNVCLSNEGDGLISWRATQADGVDLVI